MNDSVTKPNGQEPEKIVVREILEDIPPPEPYESDNSFKSGIGQLASLKSATSSWDDDEIVKVKKAKPLSRWLAYLALGFCSFFFFLYVTFPYGVIKEVIVDNVTKEIQKSGIPARLSIGSLEPYWFTGLELENVSLNNITMDSANLRLGIVRLYFNPFSLFLGRISISLYLTQVGGSADLDLRIPLIALLKNNPFPSKASLELKNFSTDAFFNHALAIAAGSQDPAMLLVAPLLSKTKIGGNLSGDVLFTNSNTDHFGDAKGTFEVSVSDGYLYIDDETLKIRKQNFETANLDVSFENNSLVIGESTKFAAEDIEIGVNGRIMLPDLSRQSPQANLNLELTMRDKIMDSLGFIVPNLLRCPAMTDGVLKVNLSGPLASMACAGI